MMNIDLDALRDRLARASYDTETALDTAIGLYKEAASYITALEEFQAACKLQLAEILAELGRTSAETPSGRCTVSKPSLVITYDRKGLDALCETDLRLRELLAPYRRVTERAGVLTIR
jgi:hypothetical protein